MHLTLIFHKIISDSYSDVCMTVVLDNYYCPMFKSLIKDFLFLYYNVQLIIIILLLLFVIVIPRCHYIMA